MSAPRRPSLPPPRGLWAEPLSGALTFSGSQDIVSMY